MKSLCFVELAKFIVNKQFGEKFFLKKRTFLLKYILLAVSMMFTFSVSAQECDAFLPFKKGAAWEITNYNAKGKETGKVKYELLEKTESGGKTSFKVGVKTFDNKGKEVFAHEYEAFCKDGKFQFDMKSLLSGTTLGAYKDMEMEIDATALEMPSIKTAVGTALKDGALTMQVKSGNTNLMKMTIDVIDRKVKAKEQKETAAGKYECMVLEQTVATKMMIKVLAKTVEWHAKGVGMVASESYNKKGKLTGYSELTFFKE